MLKWISNLIPGNVLSAIAPFLNPWVWVAILGASSASFLYATYLAHLRHEAYEQAVAAVGNAQKAIVRYVVVQQKVVDQETINAFERDKKRLARDNAALLTSLREHANRSILPPNSPPPGSTQGGSGIIIPDQLVCFDRDKLGRGLRDARLRALDRNFEVLQRGSRALLALNACVEWTEKQHTLNPTGELMPNQDK